jgi:hypothetical protein
VFDALAQAAATMAQSPGPMQLRVLQTLDGHGPSASNTLVLALPIEIVEMVRALTNRRDVVEVAPEPRAIAPRGT